MSFLRSYQRPAMKKRIIAGEIPDWLLCHPRKTYIIAAILSFPDCMSRDDYCDIQALCYLMTSKTGVEHHVDHVIPINHPKVCGLTVPWNLEVITAHANLRKGGKWSPVEQHQMEMSL